MALLNFTKLPSQRALNRLLVLMQQYKPTHKLLQPLFPDRFYIESRRVGKKTESLYLPAVLQIAQSCSLPIVATNDIRFLERQDFEAHEARVCIQEGVTLNDPRRTRQYTEQQYFRSAQEMATLFADLPEALQNTIEIAKRCNVYLTLGHNQLHNFITTYQETAENNLMAL